MSEEIKEDINIDTKKVTNFFKKYKIVLLLIIPIFFAIFFRAYSYDLPSADDLAKNAMDASIIENIEAQIQSQYPDLNQGDLEQITGQRYQQFIKENYQLSKN